MSWVAAAVAGGAIVGGAMSSNAAKKASKGQSDATDRSVQMSDLQFDVSRQDMAPYRQAGTAALSRMRDLLGIGGPAAKTLNPKYNDKPLFVSIPGFEGGKPVYNPEYYNTDPTFKMAAEAFNASGRRPHDAGATEDFRNLLLEYQQDAPGSAQPQQAGGGLTVGEIMEMDPGYQFRLDQGLRGVRNTAGASGMLKSGGALKALTRYGQDYASGEFGNIYNRLAGVAGTGQTAATNTASLGAGNAANAGNLITAGANARGAAGIAGGNAWNNAFNNIGNWWNQRNMVNQLNSGGGYSAQPMNWNTTGDFNSQAWG